MRLSEIMTAGVVTAMPAMVTDRDPAPRVFAEGVSPDSHVIQGALPQFYFHERG